MTVICLAAPTLVLPHWKSEARPRVSSLALILNQKVADKLRELPDGAGVYQMKDRRGKILYIGKALNLKNRVTTLAHGGLL